MDGNLIDRYETTVKDGKLTMGFGCNLSTLWKARNLKSYTVDITMSKLDSIELNGAGAITVDSFEYDMLKLTVNGSGTIEARGTAGNLKINGTGKCKVLTRSLLARKGTISLTGASRVETSIKETLDASITGAGYIIYSGDPKVSQSITGAGRIEKASE